MSLAAPPDHLQSLSGLEGRRSTRIDRTVPLVVLGQTKTGLSFQEKTSTVSFNLHGCRCYPSRHEYPIGSSVGLRVLQPDGETISPVIRAFVKSVHPPASPRELFQVGVELESPSNIWNLSPAPSDWNRLLGINASPAGMATAVAPALQPAEPPPAPAAFSSSPAPSVSGANGASEPRTSQVTEFPSPSPAATAAQPAKESTPSKPERVAITIEEFRHLATQERLQRAHIGFVYRAQPVLGSHID